MLLVKSTIDADVVNSAETRVRSPKPSMWEGIVIFRFPCGFYRGFIKGR